MNILNLQEKNKIFKKFFLTTPDELEKHVQSNSSDNCIHRYNVKILNIFDSELQLINAKPMIKNKFKEFLSGLNFVKVVKL